MDARSLQTVYSIGHWVSHRVYCPIATVKISVSQVSWLPRFPNFILLVLDSLVYREESREEGLAARILRQKFRHSLIQLLAVFV